MHCFAERRKYQRCDNLICKVLVSTDQKQWIKVDLKDISAGGIKFTTNNILKMSTQLYFNLNIYNMLSEFNIRIEGQTVRMEKHGYNYTYAVQFVNFDKPHQIQLDELVKSKISVKKFTHQPHLQEEVCAYVLIPRGRRSKRKIHL